eukprot:308261-Pyramimonas_sp.AAC.1
MRRKRRTRRRRKTNAHPGLINDVGMHPPSKLPLHKPLQRSISTKRSAPLGSNRVKTWRVPKHRSQEVNATNHPNCCVLTIPQ